MIAEKTEGKEGSNLNGAPKLYIETYGCQMNVNDSEIVAALLQNKGYGITQEPANADLIFINTCFKNSGNL